MLYQSKHAQHSRPELCGPSCSFSWLQRVKQWAVLLQGCKGGLTGPAHCKCLLWELVLLLDSSRPLLQLTSPLACLLAEVKVRSLTPSFPNS